jgi:hypothetical protein
MKRVLLACLVVALVIFGVTGCKKESEDRDLEGIWNIDSTEITGGVRELGSGAIELYYVMEMDIPIFGLVEYYEGSGNVGLQDYNVKAEYLPDFPGTNVTINLSEEGDVPENDYIALGGTMMGSSSIEGEYIGVGKYATGKADDIGEGDFTATQD